MRTLFIADLHLSENHRHITDALFAFLEKEATNAETLYILGDMNELGTESPKYHRDMGKFLFDLKALNVVFIGSFSTDKKSSNNDNERISPLKKGKSKSSKPSLSQSELLIAVEIRPSNPGMGVS